MGDIPSLQSQAVDIAGMEAKFNEVVAALTATIEPGASKDGPTEGSRRLALAYEQLMSSCNGVLDDLVALRQQVTLQPKVKQEQQPHVASPSATKQAESAAAGSGQPADSMDIDGQQDPGEAQQQQQQQQTQETELQKQQVAATLAQQHHSFLQQLGRPGSSDGLPVGE